MNPIQMFLRGYKVAVSNLALAWVYLGTIALLGLLMVAPLVAGLVFFGMSRAQASLEDNWMLWGGLALVFCTWVSLLLVGWFYVEGGLRGLVARAHRGAPEDYALKPRLGRSPDFKVFSMDDFAQECKNHGWRVTVLASLYAGVACLFLLPCFAPLLGALFSLDGGDPGPKFWGMMGLFLLLFLLAILATFLTSLHYQVAVTWAVLENAPWRESVRAATRLIRARPLEFLAVFGLGLGAGMAVGMLFMLLRLPLSVLSMLPGMVLVILPVSLVLMLVQLWVQGVLMVAIMGSYTAFCAPLPAAPAEVAAPTTPPGAPAEAPA